MKNSLCRALALCALFTLAGCGTKGPLYMPAPEQPSQPVKKPTTDTKNKATSVSESTMSPAV
ncbi:MAG: LPS translocon maturation chaperone LptM [Plesiomonas sp.]|uniref:LPS translocon maturation chaperone LptM n=1 Tax=Plesiomonas sp. TaxID=2486279 RepID=UPI003F35D725